MKGENEKGPNNMKRAHFQSKEMIWDALSSLWPIMQPEWWIRLIFLQICPFTKSIFFSHPFMFQIRFKEVRVGGHLVGAICESGSAESFEIFNVLEFLQLWSIAAQKWQESKAGILPLQTLWFWSGWSEISMRLLYLTNIKTPPLAKSRQPWHDPFQDTSNTNHMKPPGQTFHMSTDVREGPETPTEWKSKSVTFLRTWIGPGDAYSKAGFAGFRIFSNKIENCCKLIQPFEELRGICEISLPWISAVIFNFKDSSHFS